jgi:nitrite reductase/ring-hydroxylating ferredoxin subunit
MAKFLVFENNEVAEASFPVNKIKDLKVDGKRLCMVRTVEGFFAFAKECPHRGFDLELGNINGELQVVCPFHDYKFNLKTGEESYGECHDLKTYPIFSEEGKLFIEIV